MCVCGNAWRVWRVYVNKGHASGLTERAVTDSLRRVKPDYIYVHLGINDAFDGKSANEIVTYFYEFVLFLDEYLPSAKVIISFPLLTYDRDVINVVQEI